MTGFQTWRNSLLADKCRSMTGRGAGLLALLPDAMILIALLILGIRFTAAFWTCMDISLYDESFYMHNGFNIPELGLPGAPWSPIYSLWYLVLSGVRPDPVAVYFVNMRLMVLLPALALFIALRVLRVRPVVAIPAAIWFMVYSADIFPKVCHFASITLLLGGTIIAAVGRVAP